MTATLQAIEQLRRQVHRLETAARGPNDSTISCGIPALDQYLPNGGLAPGTLNEWVEHQPGSGGGWLALLAAHQALIGPTEIGPTPNDHAKKTAPTATPALSAPPSEKRVVVIDTSGTFYPPAAQAAGLDPQHVIVVRPAHSADALWAADQALRTPAIAAVWAHLPRLDDRQARRLQLAAEQGRTLGLWVRPREALREPSWSEVRWLVHGLSAAPSSRDAKQHDTNSHNPTTAIQRRLSVRLVRCRGRQSGQQVTLAIDSAGNVRHVSQDFAAHPQPLAAQLARPEVARRAAQRRRA